MFKHQYFVYVLGNKKDGVLYVGVTNDLKKRVFEHKNKRYKNSFSARYNVDKLIYFEEYRYINEARKREKNMKKWKRQWKIDLIEKTNIDWKDLSIEWLKEDKKKPN